VQTNDLEQNVLEPLRAWIKEYRTFKDRMSVLDNKRLEFDAERRAFHKLEIKGVHHKQANDAVDPEIAGKLEAKSGDVSGMLHVYEHATWLGHSAHSCCLSYVLWSVWSASDVMKHKEESRRKPLHLHMQHMLRSMVRQMFMVREWFQFM